MTVSSQGAEEVLARFRQQKPEAARLAELVCLAVRIEHGLLREARLRLASGMDAGAEADLWFSPLTESWSARAFVLNPAVAALLQGELLKDRERAQRAWALTERLHAQIPPIVAVEERVTWLALSQGTSAQPEIERELQAVLRTMIHDERQGAGVARWAVRAIPRLPPLARETSTARLLRFGAAARLGLRTLAGSEVPLPLQNASWLLPQSGSELLMEIRIVRTEAGLTFFHGLERAEGHPLLVPNTRPRLLEVAWVQEGEEQHRLIEAKTGATLFIPADVGIIRLRTVAGDEYELSAESSEENTRAWEAISATLVTQRAAEPEPPAEPPEAAVSSPATSMSSASVPNPAHEPELLFAWAHLSDIHWGHGRASHRADQRLVLSALERDLSHQLAQGRPSPHALLVTGDIAFSGEQEQYTQAGDWLLWLAGKLQLGARHIFTVPGNHDVLRAADKDRNVARLVKALRAGSDELDEALANEADRAQLAQRMSHYLTFVARFAPVCLEGSDTFFPAAWAHRLEERGGLRVRLVGLNTALLAMDDQDKGNLRLGKRALEHGLGALPEDNELILVLSHHPLSDGWLADGREADRWLNGRARVHLFGHVHEPYLAEARSGSGQRLIRIAAGAVHGEWQPADVPVGHVYNLAALYRHREKELLLRVWPRMWSAKKMVFVPDVDNFQLDRDCVEHVIAGIKLATPA